MRRAISVLVGVLLAYGAAGIGLPAPADAATVVVPYDTGTLQVCLGEPNCALYNGSVGLAPNPGLISNTLQVSGDDAGFIFTPTRLTGTVEAVGTGGQTATLSMNATTWFGFITVGNWSFTDPGAGVSVYMQVLDFSGAVCATLGCPYRHRVYGDTKGFFGYMFKLPGNIHGAVTII